jgi:hypothetical protein
MKDILYEDILQSILSRPRKEIPSFFYENENLRAISKITNETKDFKLKGEVFNLRDYTTELLFYKNFKNEHNEINVHKSTLILKINDDNDEVFYLYIKFHIKNNEMVRSRMVYSSSFSSLVINLYNPKTLPDFLNSYAFVNKDTTQMTQKEMITNHTHKFFMKKVMVDDLEFSINYKNRIISTEFENKLYSCRFSYKRDKNFIKAILNKNDKSELENIYVEFLNTNPVINISLIVNLNNNIKNFILKTDDVKITDDVKVDEE